jgi:hypothetical protein
MEGVAAVASNLTRPLKQMTRKLVTTWEGIDSPQKWSKHKTTKNN